MLQRIRAILCVALLAACEDAAPLEVAPGVDLARFEGRWFEIARLPRPSQKGCWRTTADYELVARGELLVVNECRQGSANGPLSRVAARAVVGDPDVPAKLSLDFGWAYGDYWILEVGEAYEYAVIGHPTRDYLWILSRTPGLPATTLDGVLERARNKGFATGVLEYTPQQ